MRHRNSSNRRFYSNIRTGQSTDAVRPLSKRTWIGMCGTRHKAPKIGWGISGIPCVPGTLSSWNPRFRNLGTTHSVYWNPRFAEPRRADLLSRCAPPCQRLLVDRAYMVLEPWFPWKLVFWDPVRSMNLGTTHGVYPTPGFFPEPRNLARTWASWKLLFRNLVPVRNLWHNPGSISKLWVRIRGGSRNLVGTQCCWNLAGTLVPQTLGFQDVSKLVFRWFQNRSKPWYGSGTLSKAKCARNLPGAENLGIPEPWCPGTQKVARTHCSQNLAWKSGLRNLGFLEPCPEPWFPEPWVPEPCPEPWFPEPAAVVFKQWSNFATQNGLMMVGTGFHSLSLFGDFLPALSPPLLDQRQDETCSLRKRA